MIQKRSIAVIVILVFLGVPSAWVFCQDTAQKEKNEDALKKNDKKTGIIFNVTDILLDLESYQGGVGIKRYSTDSLAYRVSIIRTNRVRGSLYLETPLNIILLGEESHHILAAF